MPIRKITKGGINKYRWGDRGKLYPTRKQAVAQGAAIKIAQAKRRKKK